MDKKKDLIKVQIPTDMSHITKREGLAKTAKIYDPLSLMSSFTLLVKLHHRDGRDARLSWDEELPQQIRDKWSSWEICFPQSIKFPLKIMCLQEIIQKIELHTVADARSHGSGAIVMAIVHQESGTCKDLVAAKSRFAKKDLTIPRLELISAHMATNLFYSVKEALDGFSIGNFFSIAGQRNSSPLDTEWGKGGFKAIRKESGKEDAGKELHPVETHYWTR